MGKYVEEVSASLVREYLSRKGLKKTIACMDEELPRTNSSINNRSDLCRTLHLEGLYKKNKTEECPLKSMLEIIVQERLCEGDKSTGRNHSDTQAHLLEQTASRSASDMTESFMETLYISRLSEASSLSPVNNPSRTPSEKISKIFPSFAVSPEKSERSVCSLSSVQDSLKTVIKEGFHSETKVPDPDGQKNRGSRMRRGIMAGPIASSSQESNKKRSSRRASGSSAIVTTEDCKEKTAWSNGLSSTHTKSNPSVSVEKEGGVFSNLHGGIVGSNGIERISGVKSPHRLKNSAPNPKVDELHVLEMVLDDIENEESFCDVTKSSVPELSLDKTPMDQRTATNTKENILKNALKEILFGSPMACFTEEWKQQNFTYTDIPGLKYGIIQKKGGPCGILAAVQACVLQKLLFEESSNDSPYERLQVSKMTRTKCLSWALADILWRAGDMKKAIVAIAGRNVFTPVGRYKSDGILETVTHVTVETLDALLLVLEQHVRQFETGPFGCILLTISVILSRTIAGVRSDMDVPTSTLIGAHGYCTQELVNLLLCGRAVSNVFDDEMKLDSGNGNFTLLKGIKTRCNIGLLSLFEHYNICKVGSHLKNPKYPVWVVCSESHFSVLFSVSEELVTEDWKKEDFDLYYYDGLANQQEPIRLTVYPNAAVSAQNDSTDNDLIPPLELCIRTKWRNAAISWNDSDPIL